MFISSAVNLISSACKETEICVFISADTHLSINLSLCAIAMVTNYWISCHTVSVQGIYDGEAIELYRASIKKC